MLPAPTLTNSQNEQIRTHHPPEQSVSVGVRIYHNPPGLVAEELISRDVLEKPDEEKPSTNGVFCILGEHVNV